MSEEAYLFTFGYGHAFPNKFIRFTGSFGEARQKMVKAFSDKWAFQYPDNELERKTLAKYGITEIIVTDKE